MKGPVPEKPRAGYTSLTNRASLAEPEELRHIEANWLNTLPPDDRPFLHKLDPHFLINGATGSGKTLMMRLLLMSALLDDEYDLKHRALFYDAKTDMIPTLHSLGLRVGHELILTHPFDSRSSAWDIAADVTRPALAQSFTNILVNPKPPTNDKEREDFWINASNAIIATVVKNLNKLASRNWDLRDLTTVVLDTALLRDVMRATEDGRRKYEQFLPHESRLRQNVSATLASHVSHLQMVANIWHHADSSFSIREWRRGAGDSKYGTGVLMLGASTRHRGELAIVNNLLIRSAIDEVLAVSGEHKLDQTWFFLDELREAGKFPGFAQLLTTGRSKGVRCVLAVQGISGLEAVMSRAEAAEVANQCGNKAFMQLGGMYDAKWASDHFGQEDRVQRSFQEHDDGKVSQSRSLQLRDVLPPQTFMKLRKAEDLGGTLEAHFHQPGGVWTKKLTLLAEQIDAYKDQHTRQPSESEFEENLGSAFVERPTEHEEDAPFQDADFVRLGLKRPPDFPAPIKDELPESGERNLIIPEWMEGINE